MSQAPSLFQPWTSRPMPSDKPRSTRVGQLRLLERFDGQDYWLASEHLDLETKKTGADAKEPTWLRWPLNAAYERVALKPVFADRPVVVETEVPLCLTPGGFTKIYARCPLWVRIELQGRDSLLIEELPSAPLSNTWFGDFLEGTLAYWVSSRTRTRIEPDSSQPWMAICPIHIRNTSDIELKIERICLRVEHLSLFAAEGQLWADETQVRYRGLDKISRIENTGKAPDEARDAILAAAPRETMSDGITAKTFASLRALSHGGAF